MSETARYLTFDLGAESGRAVLGSIADGKLTLEDIHRFANEPQRILGRFYWDTVRLFADIKTGLAMCARNHTASLDGIGVDTWGVDFGLLDERDELLGMPYHYRDHRTDGVMERVFEIVPRDEVYQSTGIQFMQLNTLYQLMAMRLANSPHLQSARSFLMMPDLLNFWLTGRKAVEFSIATTSQCYDPVAGDWARPMLEKLGIPTHFLGEIVQPCTKLGPLHPDLAKETGASGIVIEPATHDTGSAVAAVPAQGEGGWAYISCGTWSLVGVEEPKPVISAKTLEYNLTNEGGIGNTFRLLRNVMGLWLLQQCRRAWERRGHTYTYDQLAKAAAEAKPFATLLDPDDLLFLNPTDMLEAIGEYCAKTGQPAPADMPATVRCIVESLALKYRWVIERIESVTGRKIETVHIIGGGCRNRLLCQATSDATGCRVLAGPVEATALGNVIAQAMATGVVGSLAEGRALISRSFPLEEYQPGDRSAWDAAYAKLNNLLV